MNIVKNKGYTLVGIATVVVIIAFLMALVTTGNVLLNRSRLNSVMIDVNKFSKAIDQFEGSYGYLPGDLSDVTKLPATEHFGLVAGNGDGQVTGAVEPLQFWLHLSAAGLLPGNFDGASTYVATGAANSTASGGVPGNVHLTNAGYSIITDSTFGLTIALSYLPAANYTTSILSPADAYYIDKKFDDGVPGTGNIRGYDGSDVAAGTCVTGSLYVQATTTKGCYLKIIISRKNSFSSAPGVNTCNSQSVGQERFSTTATCPKGTQGRVMEVCNMNGSWVNSYHLCTPVTCGMGTRYGDSVKVRCPGGARNSVSLTCEAYGVLKDSNITTPQSWCSVIDTTSCVPSQVTTLPCPYGYSGTWTATCNGAGTALTITTNSCNPITCAAGIYIGDKNTAPATAPCTGSYTNGATPATEVCTMPLSGSTGVYLLSNVDCRPPTGAGACVNGTTQNIGCPKGMTGNFYQICSSGYWIPNVAAGGDTCVPVTCDGEPIGAVRALKGQYCPANKSGTMFEVCNYTEAVNLNTGIWVSSTANCF